MSATKQPMVGQTYQSRDGQYEPGRQVRIIAVDVTGERAQVVTMANPKRPKTAGKSTFLSWRTLASKWRVVTGDEVAVHGEVSR